MTKKLNIYFIHSKTLPERKSVIENLITTIKNYKFKNIIVSSVQIIDEYDPEDITLDTIRSYVDYKKIEETHVQFYNQLLKNLHVNQLSNTLKHRKALEIIAKNSNDNEINLVLEDDVLYEDKICVSLDKMLQAMPEKYDVILLGMPTTTEVMDKNKFTFQDTHKIFRVLPVCDSYLVSQSAAKALTMNYAPVKFANNLQLSFIADKIGIETLQSIPNIFIDGTKYGFFLSKLSSNNPLIFNNDFITLRSIVSKDVLTKEDKKQVEELLAKSAIKDNPDFIHLECSYHIKNQDYQKAIKRFEVAYNTYNTNGCILSNDSFFLKDYIRTHKHIQNDLD
jgi:GR25 family glycosyltransferase involved in LPS biosynthesis